MPIEDVFSISGRGTVVTGRVERGKVKVGEEIEIVGFKPTEKKVVTGVEMFRKLLDEGVAGDNIGVLLRGVEKDDVERGQVLAKPGSIKPHTKFKGEVYILSKEEGGRHTPFFNGYRPQFYIRTTDVTGIAEAAGRRRDGDAGRQHRRSAAELHRAGRAREGRAVRDPRRRPHGRRRARSPRLLNSGSGLGARASGLSWSPESRVPDPDKVSQMRDIIALACTECKRRNYSTTKNKKKTTERLELSKLLPLLPQTHGVIGRRSRLPATSCQRSERGQPERIQPSGVRWKLGSRRADSLGYY